MTTARDTPSTLAIIICASRWPITPHATSAPLLNVASRPFNPTSPRSRRAQRGQLLGLVFGHQRTRQLG